MTNATIQELTASAWHKVGKHNKGAHQYQLQVYQLHVTELNQRVQPLATWHIQYSGISFYQPFIIVSAVDPEDLMKRFDEELKEFNPVSLAEIETLMQKPHSR